jgi:hypothetical protein
MTDSFAGSPNSNPNPMKSTDETPHEKRRRFLAWWESVEHKVASLSETEPSLRVAKAAAWTAWCDAQTTKERRP